MNNVRTIYLDWYNGSFRATGGSQLAYQYDHLSNLVIFENAPKLDNYYLIVEMKETEDGDKRTLEAIQLAGPWWLVPNYYTQFAQNITFQICCKTADGDFEQHSAQFTGTVLPSQRHDGDALDIDVSVMFDLYKEWVSSVAMGAGTIVIDPLLTTTGAAADAKAAGDKIRENSTNLASIIERLDNLLTEVHTENFFNKADITPNAILNPFSGERIDYNGVFYSLIRYTEPGQYTFLVPAPIMGSDNARTVALFDASKNFVTYAVGTLSEYDAEQMVVTVTLSDASIAQGCKYFCVNGLMSAINTLMVVKADTYPSEYIPYGTYKTIEGLQIKTNQIIDLDIDPAENILRGKVLSLNGDSICAGAGFAGGYGKIIAEENGMTYENIGVGGGTVAYVNANVHCISRTISNMRSDADYVILDGGGNDADANLPLGTLTTGYTESLDDTTFAGAFEQMLKTAIERFKGKKIGYIFIHKCSWQFDSRIPNSYYGVAKSACEKWGIPYIDLNTEAPPLAYIESLRTAYTANGDGYHPNEAGYKAFYVPKITAWMKTL